MASGKTARRSIPYPVKGDPDTVAPDMGEIAKAVDNDAETGNVKKYSELPVAKTRGRIWQVTEGEEKGIWWDTGATWITTAEYIANESVKSAQIAKEAITAEKIAKEAIVGANISKEVATSASLNYSGIKAKGSKNIVTEQSRENTAFGTLVTPDMTTVELSSNGLIFIAFQATWKESVKGASKAAIFIGANQIKIAGLGAAAESPSGQEVGQPSGANADVFGTLTTMGSGLIAYAAPGNYSGDVTTGQIVGIFSPTNSTERSGGGYCLVFANAGTYEVSVQFKASSGQVTVKNRHLWVKAEAFA